jgi:hypothetical protein
MAKTEAGLDGVTVTTTGAEATSEGSESLTDRVLSFVAMAGAVVGAVAGSALGAEAGTAFPVACGTLGTMLGSGIAAGVCCILARLWTGPVAGRVSHLRNRAARSGAVTPAPRAG